MKGIEADLARAIEKEPYKKYKAIIVLDSTMNIDKLKYEKLDRLMDNVFTATLSGIEIIELIEDDIVISIDPDMELGIL